MALRPGGSGVQTYCRELITALDHKLTGSLHARVQQDAIAELPATVVAEARPVSAGLRRLAEGCRPTSGFDLVHGLDVDLPARAGAPMITTVHDLSVFDTPWAHSRTRAAGERLAISRAIRAADRVIAVSDFTAERIKARFAVSATTTRLAPRRHLSEPSTAVIDCVRRTHGLPDTFVLHLGTIEPRKSVDLLAEACRRIGVELVLAGAATASLRDPRGTRHLGYVDEQDLAGLFCAASAVAYVSVYEGFGLPPIEAIACGAPVVATAVGALPEVLGSDVPLVAPGDLAALTDALGAAVTDSTHRQQLIDGGRRAVAALSWDQTAAATLDVYRSFGVQLAQEVSN